MKVIIALSAFPFTVTPARIIANSLASESELSGHQVDILVLPMREGLERADIISMVTARQIDCRDSDALVALNFPALLIPHRRKIVWTGIPTGDTHTASPRETVSGRVRGSDSIADLAAQAERSALLESQRVIAASSKEFERIVGSLGVEPELLDFPSADVAPEWSAMSLMDRVFA